MNEHESNDNILQIVNEGNVQNIKSLIDELPNPESSCHAQYLSIITNIIQEFEKNEYETVEPLLGMAIQKLMKYYFNNYNAKEFLSLFKQLCKSKHIDQILELMASHLNEYFTDNDIHNINVLVHYQAPIFAELIQNISSDLSIKLFSWFDKADQLFPYIFDDSLELLKSYYKLIYHGFFQNFILPIQNPAQGCTPLSEHQRTILGSLKKKIAQIATEIDSSL